MCIADIDFDKLEILVRDTNGYKNHITLVICQFGAILKGLFGRCAELLEDDLKDLVKQECQPGKKYPGAGKI
jgi:hypothetical protein